MTMLKLYSYITNNTKINFLPIYDMSHSEQSRIFRVSGEIRKITFLMVLKNKILFI